MSTPLVLGLWSAVVEPGKTLNVNTTPAIQITSIAYGPTVTGSERAVVMLKYPEFEQDSDDEDEDDEEDEEDDEDMEDGDIKLPKLITKEAVLAHLRPNAVEQVSINLSLVEDVEVVELSVTGPNAVHLLGHYIRQEDFDQDPYSDSDDESIDSDLIDDSELGMSGLLAGGGSDDEDDEDEDDEDEDDEGRIEEVQEELRDLIKDRHAAKEKEIEDLIKERNAAKKNPKKRSAEDDEVSALLSKPAAAASAGTNGEAADGLSKNQKKKLAKKQKTENGAAAPAPAAAAPAPAADKPKKAVPQTLSGGLVITDAKKGDGPTAKSGKKVSVRYIGKLENGKVFDSNTKGAPLSFNLGRGEVIKGWDQGIVGMAVGGERKLVIPAALAYGKKGTQGIPGNATLHFDVKMLAIK